MEALRAEYPDHDVSLIDLTRIIMCFDIKPCLMEVLHQRLVIHMIRELTYMFPVPPSVVLIPLEVARGISLNVQPGVDGEVRGHILAA